MFTTKPGSSSSLTRLFRCWVSEFQAPPDLGCQRERRRHPTLKLENEGWERDYDVKEPSEPTFVEPA